jgi:hypothetical protein
MPTKFGIGCWNDIGNATPINFSAIHPGGTVAFPSGDAAARHFSLEASCNCKHLSRSGTSFPGRNPRGYFDPSEMTELEESVKSKGVLQAILVRPRDAGRFEIVAGERRWRAAKKVFGDEYEIPALVRDLDDGEADEAALIENIQRANMSPDRGSRSGGQDSWPLPG